MQEYDLFVPLFYNDGTSIESAMFPDLQARLLDEFGRLTFFPQPDQGFWRMGNVTYRDEIVIYRVIATKPRTARRFLTRLKEELKKRLRQVEILIVERTVWTL